MPRRRERHVRDEVDYSEGETLPRCRRRHKSRRGVKRRKHRDRNRHRHHHRRKRDREPSPTASYSYGYEDARSHSTRYRKRKAIKKEAEEIRSLNQLNEDVSSRAVRAEPEGLAAIMSQGQNVVDNERNEEVDVIQRVSKHEIEEFIRSKQLKDEEAACLRRAEPKTVELIMSQGKNVIDKARNADASSSSSSSSSSVDLCCASSSP